MMEKSSVTADLNWLLDDLVDRVVGTEHAIVLSADGLLIGRSRDLTAEDGEHLSAVASAFQSLARGTGRQFGGGAVRQTVVEMERAYLFVTAAGDGACLAVLASEGADVGLVAYEMNMRINRVGRFLTSAPRVAETRAAAGGAES
ncbi:putative regulator of Ras-like GTPase activity (Roadblock/LC7/MglB family) [Lipingzhangella halophila]|uniref:Putative regulator of Ras-like GTPase activity (Roadblock/LC7/MglB family) n=1 Tax=Lipingzhangella halophila TaxID=1783352 RepID=A0A7W7RIA3_9ACTN|nr:roadblock/LC7 domain-containing protein [Lipingzhangella halophila]MBB4932485.1 putative regulator of Ras-like GTPase activity (Roadblock/LC7/MglB family) [Lipingzhangella halophila]